MLGPLLSVFFTDSVQGETLIVFVDRRVSFFKYQAHRTSLVCIGIREQITRHLTDILSSGVIIVLSSVKSFVQRS